MTLQPGKVLNLACSGASVTQGLRGSQQVGQLQVPPQVGRLKRVAGVDFVVVAIGPNDLNWADLLRYCYGVSTCNDRLTSGEFDYRLAAFDADYAALLRDLNELPDRPKILIMTSYEPFAGNADPACPDLRGPPNTPGLDRAKIELLADRNAKLNEILRTGAARYGFTVVQPDLTALCGTHSDGLGPDLQGLTDPHPFHPTAVGSLRIAAAVARYLPATGPR